MTVAFDKQSAKRISKAVRRVEQMPAGQDALQGSSRQSFSRRYFWARISAATATATATQWTYTFVEIEKTSTGYGGWADKTGGRTGTAYNTFEDNNSASGTQGDGVDIDNLAGTGFTLQPVPVRSDPVLVYWIYLADGTIEYWISVPNAIDGECEEAT
jgi:hypothetical protein